MHAGAISSVIYDLVEQESTCAAMAEGRLLGWFRGVPIDHQRRLISQVAATRPSDLRRVADRYLSRLFDARYANTAVICSPSRTADVAASLDVPGFTMRVLQQPEQIL